MTSNSTSSESNSISDVKLEQIRKKLSQNVDKYYQNVQNVDVGWMLRDSDISGSLKPEAEQDNEKDRAEVQRIKSNHSDSLVMPHLETAISNANLNNASKSRPSVSLDDKGIALSRTMSQTLPLKTNHTELGRRASVDSGHVPSSSSSGGFFSRLKDKFLHKGESHRESQRNDLFKPDYTLGSNIEGKNDSQEPKNPKSSGEDAYSDHRLSRTMSSPGSSRSKYNDPRLEEYIKFYKRENTRPRSMSASAFGSSRPSLVHKETKPQPNENSGGVRSFFLRRASVSNPNPRDRGASIDSFMASDKSNSSISEEEKDLSLFKELKPLKSVAFHSLTFLIDPPQQIPSRKPRKGNVEVGTNGVIKVNPLSDEDKKEIQKSLRGQGGGAVVGGMGSARDLSEGDGDDEFTKIDKHARLLAIDKPMVHRHKYTAPVKKMALDLLYTRCCHLREILPIPAILRQIPKGSLAPLPVLQLKNPTPTMIEVQTFADFVRIAPIICVCLDGIHFTEEQFKVMLSAMSAKKQLVKLSLRNTPIDSNGWFLLCWFLSRNKVLCKLDITQCPALPVTSIKKSRKVRIEKDLDGNVVARMKCNKENRSDMDWELFTATIIARGGIDELILTGCCITDSLVFENFMKHAALLKTSRLGLAYNKLSPKNFKVIVDEWLFKSFVRGIDLGYNDFLSVYYLNILSEKWKNHEFRRKVANSSLAFLSFNATGLSFSDTFKEVFENIILNLPSLYYLDFSNNPKLFGSPVLSGDDSSSRSSEDDKQAVIIAYFTSKIPLFKKLIRLQLENNNLGHKSLIAIANMLPFCKNLGYFSILGNEVNVTVGSALIQAVQNSTTLIHIDYDSDSLPLLMKEKMNLYEMSNMESLLRNNDSASRISDAVTDSSLSSLTNELYEFLDQKINHENFDVSSSKFKAFLTKVRTIRSALEDVIEELLHLQLSDDLDLKGKEALIRFIYLDSCIEKGLEILGTSSGNTSSVQRMAMLKSLRGEDEKKNATEVSLEPEESEASTSDLRPPEADYSLKASNSRVSISEQEREEGSMMKLLKREEKVGVDLSNLENLSGEEIRYMITNIGLNDLDEVLMSLKKLKAKGISLKEIFDSGDQDDTYENSELKELQKIKEKFCSLYSNDESSPLASEAQKGHNSDEKNETDSSDEIKQNFDMQKAFNEVIHEVANL